jgi:hypothetical protein
MQSIPQKNINSIFHLFAFYWSHHELRYHIPEEGKKRKLFKGVQFL